MADENPRERDEDGDWAEIWGKRIARVLAVVVALGLIIYLCSHYL
jgi:hypothetical protein